MDGHFVAGMPLVVAEPLVVAHVELAGGNPHEAGDRAGLGMQAGRGLQPGRGRIGRPGRGRRDRRPCPPALPGSSPGPALGSPSSERRGGRVLHGPLSVFLGAAGAGGSGLPARQDLRGGGFGRRWDPGGASVHNQQLPEASILIVAAWMHDSPVRAHPSIVARSLTASVPVNYVAADRGESVFPVPSSRRRPSTSPLGFLTSSFPPRPDFAGACWAGGPHGGLGGRAGRGELADLRAPDPLRGGSQRKICSHRIAVPRPRGDPAFHRYISLPQV